MVAVEAIVLEVAGGGNGEEWCNGEDWCNATMMEHFETGLLIRSNGITTTTTTTTTTNTTTTTTTITTTITTSNNTNKNTINQIILLLNYCY